MTLFRLFVVLACLAVGGGTAAAQPQPPASPAPPATPAAPQTVPQDVDQFIYARPLLRIGTPLTLGAGGSAREAVVILSDARIAGRVLRDVVVVLGNLQLEPTAVVEGAVVVVGGHVRVAEGASVGREFVLVGGSVDAPTSFLPGREQVIVGPPGLGGALREIAPWITTGLFWGRVIVPELVWTWTIVGIVLFLNLAILFMLPRAVRACSETLTARPAGAFFAGLLTLLLFPPVVTILAISVVGIVIIPFVVCALVLGWLLGKVGVARWIGAGVVREDDPDSRGQAFRSLLIGFALICVTYMIPVIGLAAWAMVGVFGLGAATLTLTAGLRRERPAPRPVPPSAAPMGGMPASAAAGAPHEVPVAEPPPSGASAAAMPSQPYAASAPEPAPYVPPAASAFQSASASRTAPGAPPAAAATAAAGARADLTTFPRSSLGERFLAAALDVLVVLMVYGLLDWWHDGRAFLALLLGYHIIFWAMKGTTVGGMIFNLRVVRTDGAPLTPADAVVRGLTSLLSAAALGLGFLWVLRDPERQAWHDRVAGTYVVTVPRNWPVR